MKLKFYLKNKSGRNREEVCRRGVLYKDLFRCDLRAVWLRWLECSKALALRKRLAGLKMFGRPAVNAQGYELPPSAAKIKDYRAHALTSLRVCSLRVKDNRPSQPALPTFLWNLHGRLLCTRAASRGQKNSVTIARIEKLYARPGYRAQGERDYDCVMHFCLGTTPTVQQTMIFERVLGDEVNRAVEVRRASAGKAVNVGRVLHTLGEAAMVCGPVGGRYGKVYPGRAFGERGGS